MTGKQFPTKESDSWMGKWDKHVLVLPSIKPRVIIFKSCVQHADLEIQLQAPEELSLIFGEAGITPKQTP